MVCVESIVLSFSLHILRYSSLYGFSTSTVRMNEELAKKDIQCFNRYSRRTRQNSLTRRIINSEQYRLYLWLAQKINNQARQVDL